MRRDKQRPDKAEAAHTSRKRPLEDETGGLIATDEMPTGIDSRSGHEQPALSPKQSQLQCLRVKVQEEKVKALALLREEEALVGERKSRSRRGGRRCE